ncbi:hypothetical protein GALMADRAFT_146554 [Galerina marginata CBS 339.88]|uniref:Uncharacterized protein n=1 Tax=Galerina marginata (strain CBS 339.88) TaxID=685588 RepID=A0A067SK26_GALM3|nr:hypothetical protein GALMADRAFT_146554 [Galerina marginata CBS 339.88]
MVSLIQSGEFVLATDKNLGAVEITTFISLILLGISLSQSYTFFRRCEESKDRFSLKFLVSLLLLVNLFFREDHKPIMGIRLLDLFHSFTASHTIYYETVTRWNRGEANSYPLSINVLTENLITFIVQCYFSRRIYILSGKLPLTIACMTLSTLRFIGGISLSVESLLDVPRTPNGGFVFTFSWLITAALAVGAAADVLIAAILVYYLRKMASPSNLKS